MTVCGGILLTLHSISSRSQSHPHPLLLDKGLWVFHAVSFRKVFNNLAFVPEAAHTDPARQVIVVALQGQRVSFDNFNFSDDGIVRRRRPSSSPSSWPAPAPPPPPPTCLGCCQLLLYSQLPPPIVGTSSSHRHCCCMLCLFSSYVYEICRRRRRHVV